MDSFFKETAEEMVNRLIKQNTFPSLTSELKSRLIFHLEKSDNDIQKELEKDPDGIDDDPDFSELEKKLYNSSFEEWLKNQREQHVLRAYIKLAAVYTKEVPPPKPTHWQTRKKPNHLRLVANNG